VSETTLSSVQKCPETNLCNLSSFVNVHGLWFLKSSDISNIVFSNGMNQIGILLWLSLISPFF